MSSYTISIQSADGVASAITVFKTAKATPTTPVFICLPAMGVKASYYVPLAQSLTKAGCHAVTADWRGIGLSSIRASKQVDFGFREMLEMDIPELIKTVQKAFPNHPLYFLGHSLGGQLGAIYLSRHHVADVKGLVMIACATPFYKGWDGLAALRLWLVARAFKAIAQLVGYFPGKKVGFAGREARTVMYDWCYVARTHTYKIAHSDFDYDVALKKMALPVLAMSFSADNFAPEKAAKLMLDKIPSATITHLHFQPADTGGKAYGHFNWAKEPDFFVEQIREWSRAIWNV